MKLVFLVGLALVCLVLAKEEKKYSDKYDYLDVDKILQNDRLRKQYVDCFMETKPCLTADAIYLKEKFPESIVTKCRKCTDQQKINFGKLITWMTENDPKTWEAALKKAITDFTTKGDIRRAKEKHSSSSS